MKILASEKLSSHKYKTPEGYLICTDAILARTGKQDYMRRELFGDSCENPDEVVWVDRKADEVFSNETLSSFENKPITVEHPDEDVNPSNYKELAVGYVRDVRRDKLDDGTEVIKGNLVITDEKTIEEILNGEHTDLSCGYDCEILDEDNPQQRRIRGNHVALCEEGRAGVARIVDSKMKDKHELLEAIDRLQEVSGVEIYAMKEGKNKNNGHHIIQYTFNSGNLIVYDKTDDKIIALIENGKTKINKLHDSIIEDSKVKDANLVEGKTYTSNSGNKLTINKISAGYSDFDGTPWIKINYSFITTDGRKGRSECFAEDFHRMMKDSKVKDSYIEISKDEIDDEHELRVDCANLGLVYINNGKYYGIKGAKKDIWKLLAMYNMNEKKKYIEDAKTKDSKNIEKIAKIASMLNKIK